MMWLGGIPVLLLVPWVCMVVVNGILRGLHGDSSPLMETMAAFVVGVVIVVVLSIWILVACGEDALPRAGRILLGVLAFDILAIPITILVVKIATPKIYDRKSLALESSVVAAVDLSGIWAGIWTDPRKDFTSKIVMTLTQSGNLVTGSIRDDTGKEWEILEGVVSGVQVNFFYDRVSSTRSGLGATLLGKVEGDSMTGSFFGHESPRPGWASTGPWEVKRVLKSQNELWEVKPAMESQSEGSTEG